METMICKFAQRVSVERQQCDRYGPERLATLERSRATTRVSIPHLIPIDLSTSIVNI